MKCNHPFKLICPQCNSHSELAIMGSYEPTLHVLTENGLAIDKNDGITWNSTNHMACECGWKGCVLDGANAYDRELRDAVHRTKQHHRGFVGEQISNTFSLGQVKTLYHKWARSHQDKNFAEFMNSVQCSKEYVTVEWCNMILCIEQNGESHT